MKTQEETNKALNAIRVLLDIDVSNAIIEDVQAKLINLTQMLGLSAETKASAKRILGDKEIEIFHTKDLDKLSPAKAIKLLNAYCAAEIATLEYADRLNSGIIHTIDALRSVISLHKTELENSMKQ